MTDQNEGQALAARDLQTLLLTGQAVTQEQDEEGICRWVTNAAASLLGASLASVVLTPANETIHRTVYGKVGAEDAPLDQTLVEDIIKLVEKESPSLPHFGRVTIVPTANLSPGVTSKGISHVARVNVRSIHRELGTLIVGKDGPWELRAGEQFVLTALANQAAVALENIRLRQDLQETNQTLRALIHASPLAIIVRDRDAKVQIWNSAAEQMFGWNEDEVLGHPYPLVPEDKQEEFRENVDRALRGEALQGLETYRRKKDGSTIDVCIWTAPLRDAGAMVILDDISQRKQTEETLLQQTRELAVADERNRLAREIHDTLAQGITGVIWQLNAAAPTVISGGEEAQTELERIRELARECLQEARRSVWDLRQGPLSGRSLTEALRRETDKLSGDEGVTASLRVLGTERVLPSGFESALLRICQEALVNTMKHAQASEIVVTLAYDDTCIQLKVNDNGAGFDPEAPREWDRETGGFGLINMRERARLLGGTLTVHSDSGRGTLVEATLPLS